MAKNLLSELRKIVRQIVAEAFNRPDDIETQAREFAAHNNLKHKDEFVAWVEDGNAIKVQGGYATQDAMYRNRLGSIADLYQYFEKEFML